MTSYGSTSDIPAGPNRGKRLSDGLRSVAKAVWFLISLLLYGVGLSFLFIGKALIALSRWEKREETALPGGLEESGSGLPPSDA